MFFYSTHIVVEGLSAVGAEGLLEVGITEEVTMAVEGLASVVRLAALAHTVDNEVIVGAVAVCAERLRALGWGGSVSDRINPSHAQRGTRGLTRIRSG